MAAANQSELSVLISGEDKLTPQLQGLESSIIRFVGSVSALLGTIKIGFAPIKEAADFEFELAQVAKTTDFVSLAFKGQIGTLDTLGTKLKEMSVRTGIAATDLAKIAAEAGQQGLGKYGVQGIVDFTQAVSTMSIALGVTTEKASTDIAKIATIFKLPMDQLNDAVSTFAAIAINSTARGNELVNTVRRIGDAAGLLNLQQSTALAATGIDFGLTVEVVGTATQKMFNSMLAHADKFAKLMGTTTRQWTDRVRTDAVGAFEDVLAKLRTLTANSQVAIANSLFQGGTRGAGLIAKYIGDSTNSVLKSNLEAGDIGKAGITAIRLQAKDFDTLNKQVEILKASFVKLGDDSTQALLDPLKRYTAQLSEALKNPEVVHFIRLVTSAVAGALDTAVSFGKALAGLNVNWVNLIQVAKVFVEIKLTQTFVSLLASATGLSGVLKSVAGSAASTAAGVGAVGEAARRQSGWVVTAEETVQTALTRRIELLQQVIQKYGQVATAAIAAGAAAATKATGFLAEGLFPKVATPQVSGVGTVVPVSNRVTPERIAGSQAGVAAAQQAALQAEAAAAATRTKLAAETDGAIVAIHKQEAARVAEIERASAQNQEAIQSDYQTKFEAIKATGTEKGLKAARAARAIALAEEKVSYDASLEQAFTYYGQLAAAQRESLKTRAAASIAAADAEVAKRKAALTTLQERHEGLVLQGAGQVQEVVGAPKPVSKADVSAAASADIKATADLRREVAAANAQMDLQAAETTYRIDKAKEAENKASNLRILALEKSFQDEKNAVIKTATAEQIASLTETHVRLLDEEKISHTARLAEIESFHAKEAATDAAEVQQKLANLRIVADAAQANAAKLAAEHALQSGANGRRSAELARAAGLPQTAEGAAADVVQKRTILTSLDAASARLAGDQEALLQTRLAEVDAKGNVERMALQKDFQEARRDLEAGGSITEIEAQAAAQSESLELQKAAHAQSLVDTEAYYRKRFAIQTTSLAAERAAQRTSVAESLLNQRAVGQAATGAAGVVVAARVTQVASVASRAATVFSFLGTAVSLLWTGLTRMLGPLTLIYFVLSAVVDHFGGWSAAFTKLSNALGFYSKSQEAVAVRAEEAIKKIREQRAELNELTAAYEKHRDITTGIQDPAAVEKALKAALTASTGPNADAGKVASLTKEATELIRGAEATAGGASANKIADNKAALAADLVEQKRAADEIVALEADKQRRLQAVIVSTPKALQPAALATAGAKADLEFKKPLEDARAAFDAATEAAKHHQDEIKNVEDRQKEATATAKVYGDSIAKVFTPATAAPVLSVLLPLKKATDDYTEAGKVLADLQSKVKSAVSDPGENTGPGIDKAKKAVLDQEGVFDAASKRVTEYNKQWLALINAPGIPPKVREDLLGIAAAWKEVSGAAAEAALNAALPMAVPSRIDERRTDLVEARIAERLALFTKSGLGTGTLAPKPPPATTGTTDIETDKQRNEAERIAKAKLELLLAQGARIKAAADAQAKGLLEIDQRGYDQGLINIAQYYTDREKIQKDALARDVDEIQKSIDYINSRLTGKGLRPKDEVARLGLETEREKLLTKQEELRAKSHIDTLANFEGERKATEALNDKLLDTQIAMEGVGVASTDVRTQYEENIAAMQAKERAFRNQLAAPGLAPAGTAGTTKVGVHFDDLQQRRAEADATARQGLLGLKDQEDALKAFDAVIKTVNADVSLGLDALSRKQAEFHLAVTQGTMTSLEAEAAYSDAVKAQLPLLQAQLDAAKATLAQLTLNSDTESQGYKQKAAEVDALKLKMNELGASADQTARGINKSLVDSWSTAFDKLTQKGARVKDIFTQLLFGIADNIKKISFQDLSQKIVNSVGSGGAGGFGGFIQKALTGKAPSTTPVGPAGTVNDPIYVVPQTVTGTPFGGGTKGLGSGNVDTAPSIDRGFLVPFGNTQADTTAATTDFRQLELQAQKQDASGGDFGATQGPLDSFFASVKSGFTDVQTFLTDSFGKVSKTLSSTFPSVFGSNAATVGTAGVGSPSVTTTAPTAGGKADKGGNVNAQVAVAGLAVVGSFAAMASATTKTGKVMGALSLAISLLQLYTALTTPSTASLGVASAVAATAVTALGTAASVAAVKATVAHGGGVIGGSASQSRSVSPFLFLGAPRYHGGGTAGLSPNEVPTILEKGEAVLTKNQQSLVAAAIGSGNSSAQAPMNIRNVLVTDHSLVTDVLGSSQGEKVLMSFIQKNRVSIQQQLR